MSQSWIIATENATIAMTRRRGSRRASHDPRPRKRGETFTARSDPPAAEAGFDRLPRVDQDRRQDRRGDDVGGDDGDVRRGHRIEALTTDEHVAEDEEE